MASFSQNRHHHLDDRHLHHLDDRHLHLPNDILIDVLKRLPVKSLQRFKCVCKNWYDLIQNPNFAQTHLCFQKLHNKGRLLLQHFNKDTEQYGWALFPDETLANDEYHHLDHLRHGAVLIEGLINGLFCLFNYNDIVILWNPAIREFRNLPYPNPNLPSYLRLSNASIGFGLDPLTDDDYKVVIIRRSYNPIRHLDVCPNVMVYSLRTNTWRQLDCLDGLPNGNRLPFSNSNTYLNGVYHWVSWEFSANGFACAVVAFDMGKEVFREIPGPDIGQAELSKPLCNLSLYDDHVALHHLKGFCPTEIDIWVMEVEGTWVKRFALGPLPGVVCQLGFWKTGELLFVTNDSLEPCGNPSSQVVMYNPSTHEFRELGPKGTDYLFKAGVYYESLVSVEGGKYQRKGKLSELSIRYFFLPTNVTV